MAQQQAHSTPPLPRTRNGRVLIVLSLALVIVLVAAILVTRRDARAGWDCLCLPTLSPSEVSATPTPS